MQSLVDWVFIEMEANDQKKSIDTIAYKIWKNHCVVENWRTFWKLVRNDSRFETYEPNWALQQCRICGKLPIKSTYEINNETWFKYSCSDFNHKIEVSMKNKVDLNDYWWNLNDVQCGL